MWNGRAQAERIEQLRLTLNIDRMHIVGNSMGGMIAGAYAYHHPEQTMSLFDTGGIVSPLPSDYYKEIKQGRNPLLIQVPEDVNTLLRFSFAHPPYMPDSVMKAFYEIASKNREWNRNILLEIAQESRIVEDALPHIKAPIMVIWGKEDRIIHVSSTEIIKRIRPDAEIHILEECGHAPMLEKVSETASITMNFLNKNQPRIEVD